MAKKFQQNRHQDELRSFLLKTKCIVDLNVEYEFETDTYWHFAHNFRRAMWAKETQRHTYKWIKFIVFFNGCQRATTYIRSILSAHSLLLLLLLLLSSFNNKSVRVPGSKYLPVSYCASDTHMRTKQKSTNENYELLPNFIAKLWWCEYEKCKYLCSNEYLLDCLRFVIPKKLHKNEGKQYNFIFRIPLSPPFTPARNTHSFEEHACLWMTGNKFEICISFFYLFWLAYGHFW